MERFRSGKHWVNLGPLPKWPQFLLRVAERTDAPVPLHRRGETNHTDKLHRTISPTYDSTLRSQVGFAAAVAHARLRLLASRLSKGLSNSLGVFRPHRRTLYESAARAFISLLSRRGEALRALCAALWERDGQGTGYGQGVRRFLSVNEKKRVHLESKVFTNKHCVLKRPNGHDSGAHGRASTDTAAAAAAHAAACAARTRAFRVGVGRSGGYAA